jgi:adenine-specific DNA-methyltransferase
MIKYIGSKRLLVPRIVGTVRAFADARTVLDLFSGTARVGHALKSAGLFVIANDHNAYAHVLARCYVQADSARISDQAARAIRELAALPSRPGYFTQTFCERSRFFHPKNGARIDAIREDIDRRVREEGIDPDMEAVLLTSLMEAADRVDSTTGLQMAYLKSWAPRALNDLELRLPQILAGSGRAIRVDAREAARQVECDVAYIDPPYNQHSYLGNYHIWETLVRWDKPEVYGTACKRIDCRTYRNDFNSKPRIREAVRDVISSVRAKHLLVSFNNEGYVEREEIEEMLRERGHVRVIEVDFKRYVGAQIGIYNPAGDKVGKISHLRNTEYLFVVSEKRSSADAAADVAESLEGQIKLF